MYSLVFAFFAGVIVTFLGLVVVPVAIANMAVLFFLGVYVACISWRRSMTILVVACFFLGIARVTSVHLAWCSDLNKIAAQTSKQIICGSVTQVTRDKYPLQYYSFSPDDATEQVTHLVMHQYLHPPVEAGNHYCIQAHRRTRRRHLGYRYATQKLISQSSAGVYIVERVVTHKAFQPTHRVAIRQWVRQQLSLGASQAVRAFLWALMLGDRSLLLHEQWQQFARAGVSHLIAISGLHVALFVGLCAEVFCLLAFFFTRLYLLIPRPKIKSIIHIFFALLYAYLMPAGMPTERAVMMIVIWSVLSLIGCNRYPLEILLTCFIIFIWWNPFVLYSVSFVLSYFAVFWLLLYRHGLFFSTRPRLSWLLGHCWMYVGLFPLTLFYFHRYSLVALLCNVIAIPWVGICILPLTILALLAAALSTMLANALMCLAHYQVRAFLSLMGYLSAHPIVSLRLPAMPVPVLVLCELLLLFLLCQPIVMGFLKAKK